MAPLALSSETVYQRARHCARPEKHRSESGYEVSLPCQSFILTRVQMIGLWNCPPGPSECFRTAEKKARSLVSPEANEPWDQKTGGAPRLSLTSPSSGRAGHVRKALGSPTRRGQQGSEGRLAGSSRSLCMSALPLSFRFCYRNLSSHLSVALVGVADVMLSWGYHENRRCQVEAKPGQGLGSQGGCNVSQH